MAAEAFYITNSKIWIFGCCNMYVTEYVSASRAEFHKIVAVQMNGNM
jgi:hypothetical protein